MIKIGMDYYPEQWDESLWEKDIEDMAALGVKTVRVAEFAWCRMEPEKGMFDFGWLDRVIEMIGAHGMQVILGTPTNCPPMWLIDGHPEILQMERDGRRTFPYIRGHRCETNPVFRKYAARIIREMASRYAGRQEIFAWQIDNEIENNHCTCPSCTAHFRDFLKKKYGTLENLNRCWGTVVWSGEFTKWEQIHPLTTMPVNRPGWFNPAYILDCERFASESTAEYAKFQADIIRRYDPEAVITTNSCFGDRFQDFRQEFAALDVASYDNYPAQVIPSDPAAFYSNAFALDFVRSFRNKKFWIMEQLAGPTGCWGPLQPAMEPGMLEGYALQAVAHGAVLVSFFRWRTASAGAEMFCYGLLDHNGRKNRRYRELDHLIQRLRQYPDLENTAIQSDVAILLSYASGVSLRTQGRPDDDVSYWTHLKLFHEAAMNVGVNVDIVRPEDPFEKYRVLIVPAYFVTSPDCVEKIKDFAREGGTVVVSVRSGVKDEHGNCIMFRELPAGFTDLVGCHVEESDAIGVSRLQSIKTTDGHTFRAGSWCDILAADTAEVCARYQEKFYAGAPAVTKNHFGLGRGYYFGTVGEKAMYRYFLQKIFREADVKMMDPLPEGVEAVTRTGEDRAYVFIFNNTLEKKSFTYAGRALEMKPLEMMIYTL